MNWLDKLQRKTRWQGISGLMTTVVIGMAVVLVAEMFAPDYNIAGYLAFVPSMVAKGQVWRLLTFIFLPPDSSPLWMVFALYFYFSIGRALEYSWGSFRFTMFYVVGWLGAIIAGLITGYGTNTYLNLSLFFAYAIIFPDAQFLLFFVIPIKAKYLAIVDAALYLLMLILGSWSVRAAIIASFLNLALFFGGHLITKLRDAAYYRKTRAEFRRQTNGSQYDNRYGR